MSAETYAELQEKAREVERGADRLAELTKEFEGPGGPRLGYELALDAALISIYEGALDEGKRPPAEDVRLAMARQQIRSGQPELYERYHALSTQIIGLRRWLSDRKASISARQSVLSAEKATMGVGS